ncbi:unnamed protein product [Rhizophagus irregularis]|nr:unnamed protein product [Rhizophagus irregularis]
MDRLIGNEELIRYGYILEDWDVNIRFGEFYEWYKEAITSFVEYETDSDDTPRSYTITETDDGEEENLPISKNEEMSDEESDESNESNNVEETETTKIFEEIIRNGFEKMGYDKYLTIWNLEDEELDETNIQWRVENTKECERCEIERLRKNLKSEKKLA